MFIVNFANNFAFISKNNEPKYKIKNSYNLSWQM